VILGGRRSARQTRNRLCGSRRLLALAGNRVLVEQIAHLRSRTRLYGLRRLAEDGTLTSSAREHSALLDLLLARDAAAEDLMRRHIGHVRGTWAGISE
jgi:DNA-binding GntR family transcriptional regulator